MWNSFCFALFRRQGLCPALCSSFTPIFPYCSLHPYRHQLRPLQSNSLQFLNHGVQISHDGSSPSVMLLFHSLCVALDTFESKAKLGDAYPENTDILCLLTVHNTHIYRYLYSSNVYACISVKYSFYLLHNLPALLHTDFYPNKKMMVWKTSWTSMFL